MQKPSGQLLSCQDIGNGFPLVFGHSYLWEAAMWQPQVNVLKNHYRCLVPEVWGHGGAPCLSEDTYTVEALAEDHLTLLDAKNVSECALIGLSLGGMWGTYAALAQPERVKALVLMNTYVGPEPEITRDRYFTMLDMVGQFGAFPEVMVEQVVPMFFSPYTMVEKPQLVEAFVEKLLRMPEERVQSLVTIGRAVFSRESILERLCEIQVPTLIIAGENDRVRPVPEAMEMAHLIPNAELKVIPRAGHISSLETPSAVTTALLEFLGQHLEPSAATEILADTAFG